MRMYPIHEIDVMFDEFDGIGELIIAVCEIEKSNRANLVVALTNHIRATMKETRVIGLAIGTLNTTGERFVRVSIFDKESDGSTYELLNDENKKLYIEIE